MKKMLKLCWSSQLIIIPLVIQLQTLSLFFNNTYTKHKKRSITKYNLPEIWSLPNLRIFSTKFNMNNYNQDIRLLAAMMMIKWNYIALSDWLVDWLIGSLWPIDWLIDWLIVSLIEWPIDWLIGWLIFLMVDGLID